MTQPWPPLPPKPNALTDAERAGLDPTKRLDPAQKRAGLAILALALEKQLGTHPALQPLTVRVDTRPDGFSLHVDIPPTDTRNDIALPGPHGHGP